MRISVRAKEPRQMNRIECSINAAQTFRIDRSFLILKQGNKESKNKESKKTARHRGSA